MGGTWAIHCRNYDCPHWSDCDWGLEKNGKRAHRASECEDPAKQIVFGELPT